jgi:hypothetical protein
MNANQREFLFTTVHFIHLSNSRGIQRTPGKINGADLPLCCPTFVEPLSPSAQVEQRAHMKTCFQASSLLQIKPCRAGHRAKPAPFILKAKHFNSEVTLYPSSGAVVKSISFE